MRPSYLLPALLLQLLLLPACRHDSTRAPEASNRPASAPPARVDAPLRILAAASFTDVLGDVKREYERANPGARVDLAFGGSQELRMQLEQGAQADAFVSANASHLDALETARRATGRRPLACNHLVIVTPASETDTVGSYAELSRARRIVLGVETSPIGRYTEESLAKLAARDGEAARAAILAHVVSRELDVRQVVAKVRLGEADAAIVYATDALAAGANVRTLPIEPALDVITRAYVARIVPEEHPAETAKWLAFLFSPESERSFRARGFVDCPAQ